MIPSPESMHERPSKSRSGLPPAAAVGWLTPSDVRRRREARKARRRLYPVTFLYTAYSFTVLAYAAARTRHVLAALSFFAAGVAAWTAVEYLAHRYVLHGRFPDGDGVVKHLLHTSFDHLHVEHHQRPWDGNHISGTTMDTLPFVAALAASSFLAPVYSLPVLIAGVVQSYVAEEWVHHSVHFCRFKNRYFRYIRRHHLYHHSPMGSDVAFGLTNGFWDIVWATRVPEAMRRRLHAGPRLAAARLRRAALTKPAPAGS